MEITDYIKQVNEQFRTGNAREHSYRPMLQQLLSDMLPGFVVTNEPARVSCGAPDYIITRKEMPVFFVEAKDINDGDLDGHNQHREQFNRYKEGLDHVIFTDYLDFHLYENGEWVRNVRLAEVQGNNIRLLKENVDDFRALVAHIADTQPTPITSATRLAEQMAAKARILAATVTQAFHIANEEGENSSRNQQLQGQLEAFRRILIHDLTPEAFADIYAQTVAYGMFAARLHDKTPEDFSRQEAAVLIPRSNPFLRQIFQSIAGYDLDDRIAWVVDDLVSIFLATDIRKVMTTYASNGLHHDPMIHFYEDFLSAYNPQLRKSKGVWYTPQPVVQFIVRAVDEILQRDFGLADGLADHSIVEREVVNDCFDASKKANEKTNPRTIKRQMHRVQILDPATGTGTFLAETVNQIYDKFRGMQGMWQGYVTDHLIPRLHGFELLMASYAVAHLKLDMLLQETGFVQPADQKRLKIYLTNSLEECHPDTGTLWSSWLSNEANEANHIKRDCPVMVMMGNPPYSGISQNHGEWIAKLMNDYKFEPNCKVPLQERKTWLNDDYVKFIRLAQDYVERNSEGIIGFINNNGFIENPTFRGMRWKLLETFDEIYILNLHGNSMTKETAPDGSKDENVFDIMVGVSINIFVKTGKKNKGEIAKVFYKDIYGLREHKYEYLSVSSFSLVEYEQVLPTAPYYFFFNKNENGKDEYDKYVRVDTIFNIGTSGSVSANDNLNISFSVSEQKNKIKDLLNLTEIEWRSINRREKDSRDWKYLTAKADAKGNEENISPISYRPFDVRYTCYTGNSRGLYSSPQWKVMQHLNMDNIALTTCRQQSTFDFQHVFITNHITDMCSISSQTKETGYVFPLYLYTDNFGNEEKTPNLNQAEWDKFNKAVGRNTTPEELLAYIYAILHSPTYRERYKEFLKVDFPRIPLPESAESFDRMAALGQQLIDLHLMKNTQAWKLETTFPVAGDQTIQLNKYDNGNVWINKTQYFGNVPEAAWNFFVGGYQPAQKWLKDRKGRTLTFDDINHYRRIIYALSETERLMNEIG